MIVILELGAGGIPGELDGAGGAVALFGDDEFGHADFLGVVLGPLGVVMKIFFAMKHHDGVGILFDGA